MADGAPGDRAAGDGDAGAEVLVAAARDLVAAVEAAVGPWVMAVVTTRHGDPLPDRVRAEAERAAVEAEADLVPKLADLLALDIDDQWTNPLAIIRTAARYPTGVLAAAGVAPVARDETAAELHPDDVYDLAPASFADLGPDVHEPGIIWGAAKAHLHLRRRRHEEAV